MTPARYAGNALPHLPLNPETDATTVRQWHAAAWLCGHRVRWCPRGLRENGGRWPLRWLLPWTFACVEHRTYLASACQLCQSTITFGADSMLPARCDARMADDRFTRYEHDEKCDFPLRSISPFP